jgi:hypothetical protein
MTYDLIDFHDDGTQDIFVTQEPWLIGVLEQGKQAQLDLVRERQESEAAYRPAKEFLHPQLCRTHKQLARLLLKNPAIRTRRPRSNRLEVHAGDWQDFLRLRGAEVFDLPAALVLALIDDRRERARRQDKERRKNSAAD